MKTIFTFLFLSFSISLFGQGQPDEPPSIEDLKDAIIFGVYPNIDGVIVEIEGEILIEEYFSGFHSDSIHDTRSAFKSIMSLLVGIAIDKELLDTDDKLSTFFPEVESSPKKDITVHDLLEMRSGLDCEEFYGSGPDCESEMETMDDWIQFGLNIEMKDDPGINWSYTSINPLLLGEIVSRVSGQSIMEFAEQNLFGPLGIEKYQWTITPRGRGMTAGSFYMRPLDMLKIIQLVKNEGEWGEEVIVSSDWIDQSIECEIGIDFSFVRFSKMKNARHESARYGYYWYRENLYFEDLETEVLFASGNGGQYMMWLEDYDATIVFTGSNYGNWRGKLPFEILVKYVIPIIEANE